MHWTERLTQDRSLSVSGHASRSVWPLAGRGRVQVGRSHRRRRRGRTRPQRKAPLPRHPATAVPVACMTPPAGVRQPYIGVGVHHRLVRLALATGTVSQITAHAATACLPPWPLLYVRTYCRERRVDSRVRWTDSDRTGSDGWAVR
jgi:hypothetical protein